MNGDDKFRMHNGIELPANLALSRLMDAFVQYKHRACGRVTACLAIAAALVLAARSEAMDDANQEGGLIVEQEEIAPRSRWQEPVRATALSVNITPSPGELPSDSAMQTLADEGGVGMAVRNWSQADLRWTATGLCHWPLYFDDVPLERYGQTPCRIAQPALSAAHFFGTVPLLPYKMSIDAPRDCQFTLGYYRPGSPAPCHMPWMPLNAKAGVVEAGTIAGLILLIP